MAREIMPSEPPVHDDSQSDSARITDIFAMILHDIKSPLTVILGYSSMLLTEKIGELSGETAEMISGMHKSGLALLGMVEDLLTVTLLESDRPELDAQWTCLEGVLAEAHDMFWIAAMSKGVDFTVEQCYGMPEVAIDRRLVTRALSNLVQNAIKYTPQGGRVTVRGWVSPGEGDADVVLSVTDSGPGIPEDEQARVFEKYYRSKKTSCARGTGLGLAIVKGVAELHGGRVELRSGPDTGSTFTLILRAMRKAA